MSGEKSADFFEEIFPGLPEEKYFFWGHPLPRKKFILSVVTQKNHGAKFILL